MGQRRDIEKNAYFSVMFHIYGLLITSSRLRRENCEREKTKGKTKAAEQDMKRNTAIEGASKKVS